MRLGADLVGERLLNRRPAGPVETDGSPRAAASPALIILASLAAGVIGGLSARWLDRPHEPELGTTGSGDGQTGQIVMEIRALTEAVAALAQRPPRDQAPDSTASPPEALRVDAAEALESALARFAESVKLQSQPSPTELQRSSLALPSDAQAARGRVEPLFGRDEQAVKQDHFFLSVRDIVERYGLPDRISVNNQKLVLAYKSADGRSWQEFATYDGLVIDYERYGQ